MPRLNKDIPVYVDTLLSSLAEGLHNSITNGIASVVKRKKLTLNLMYSLPRINAKLHFAHLPCDPVDADRDIAGWKSKYFTKLLKQSLPTPKTNELLALSRFALRCPHGPTSTGRLMSLMQADALHTEKAITNDLRVHDPVGFMCALLAKFSDRDTAFLRALEKQQLLFTVIHTLLSLIPQYDDTPLAEMGRNGKGRSEDQDGIRWVLGPEKLKSWTNGASASSARNRVFWLLSIIESSQWHDGTCFGIIDSLYDFLKLGHETDPAVTDYALTLDRLGLYFNAKTVPKDDRHDVAAAIRNAIEVHILELEQLVVVMTGALSRADQFAFAPLLSGQAEQAAMSLLGMLSPVAVTACQCSAHASHVSGIRLRRFNKDALDQHDHVPDPSQERHILTMSNTPWGVYETAGDIVECPGGPCEEGIKMSEEHIDVGLRLPDGSPVRVQLHYNVGAKDISTVRTSDPHYAGELICNIQPWLYQPSTGLPSQCATILFEHLRVYPHLPPDWYREAFDELYIEFDILRHSEQKNPLKEVVLRRDNEVLFYDQLLKKYFPANDPVRIVEIGIGYGRLAQQLIKHMGPRLDYHGIDQSPVMVQHATRVLGDHSRRRLCDMDAILATDRDDPWHEAFDLVVFAYTTFGSYVEEARNMAALKQAADLLRSGGVLVIEQHNPCSRRPEEYIRHWGPSVQPGPDKRYLLKSTEMDHRSEAYTRYRGGYWYYSESEVAPKLLKYAPYEVQLYMKGWFDSALPSLGFATPSYCGNYDLTRAYQGGTADAVMICIAIKNSLEPANMKEGLKEARDLLVSIASGAKEKKPYIKQQTGGRLNIDQAAELLDKAQEDCGRTARVTRATASEVGRLRRARQMLALDDRSVEEGLDVITRWSLALGRSA